MIREQIESAKTVELAVEAACKKLGVAPGDPREVKYEVLELPKKGFLGLGAAPAKVRVYLVEQTKVERAVEYLQQVLSAMGFSQVEIDVREEENGAVLTLSGEGLGVIIGRRGETLDALQYLAGLVANKIEGDYYRITLDSGNYREKREKTLEALAKKLATNAVKTGKSSTLEPMNPYERRIIHAAVQQVEGATSTSIGDEPNRRIVISSTNPRRRNDRRPPRSGGRPGGKDERPERRSGGPRRPYERRENTRPLSETPVQEETAAAPRTKVDDGVDRPLYSKIEL